VGPQRAPTVQTQGQLYNATDYSKLIVTYRKGSPVRLGDLGRVIDRRPKRQGPEHLLRCELAPGHGRDPDDRL